MYKVIRVYANYIDEPCEITSSETLATYEDAENKKLLMMEQQVKEIKTIGLKATIEEQCVKIYSDISNKCLSCTTYEIITI